MVRSTKRCFYVVLSRGRSVVDSLALVVSSWRIREGEQTSHKRDENLFGVL